MNQKTISKRISYIILAIIFFEIIVFGGWYFTQPTYKATVLSIVTSHESPNQSYYFASTSNKNLSLDSIYNAVSIYNDLNESVPNKDALASSIMGSFNTSTGLFSDENVSSIEATYQAVNSLSMLGKVSEVNKTRIINSIWSLRTNDSLFREYNELNSTNQVVVGELDHSYEAISALNILYNNKTQLLVNLNINKTLLAISSLQNSDGGFLEGVLYSNSNMKNAYYVVKLYGLLNQTSNYETLGFRQSALSQWIENMYTNNGFKMQGSSQPSVEATAYALIAFKYLGYSDQNIQSLFPDGYNSIEKFLDTNFLNDKTRNPLDVLHDILGALTQINQIGEMNNPYFSQTDQFYFASTFAIFILAFVVNTIINLGFALKEDDTKYFEGELHVVLENIFTDEDLGQDLNPDLSELSDLLGQQITKIEIIDIPEEDKLAILKAYTDTGFFLISYETFSYLAKKIEKYTPEEELLSSIDFLESDIFFTVEEGRNHLLTNQITE